MIKSNLTFKKRRGIAVAFIGIFLFFGSVHLEIPATQVQPQGVSALSSAAWTTGGPYGGYVNYMAIAPSNPNVLYAGTDSGIYKTTDGGSNWSEAGLSGLEITVVAVDPTDPTKVYAGAGFETEGTDGFYKSVNGGSSWTSKAIPWVTALAVDPNGTSTLFLGTRNGKIYKSTNSGGDWTLKHTEIYSSVEAPISSIVVDPANSSWIYAGTGIYGHGYRGDRGFLKSINGGETWTGKHIGALGPWDHGYSVVVTPSGFTPHTLYIIATGDDTADYNDDVFKSTDQGETWSEMYMPLLDINSQPSTLAIDPLSPLWLYAGTSIDDYPIILYDGSDGKWYDAGSGLLPVTPSNIVIDSTDNSILYTGLPSVGVFKSTNYAVSWSRSHNGLNNAYINDIAVHPTSASTAFAAVEGYYHHMHKTTNAGTSWGSVYPASSYPTDINAVAFDSSNPSILFAGSKRIYRSANGGYDPGNDLCGDLRNGGILFPK